MNNTCDECMKDAPYSWCCKMENSQKPPIGLKPRYIHDSERIDEILCAIERYTDANMSIPKSWVNELRDLVKANLK